MHGGAMQSGPWSAFEKDLTELLECFGSKESDVLRRLASELGRLPEDVRQEVIATVGRARLNILPLVQAIHASPIHRNYQFLKGPERRPETLIETLCRKEWESIDLALPTGAVVGRALVLARINFIKSLRYSLESCSDETSHRLRVALQDRVDDAIFSKMAEELLTGATTNPANAYKTRRAAARHLFSVWTNFVRHPVADFPTALLSAWKARRKVQQVYGTLIGVHELVSLIREECETDFVSFFTRDEVSSDQVEAFREFLFGLSYEQLQDLQRHMREHGLPLLSHEQVHDLVDTKRHQVGYGPPAAEEVLASYRRRRLRADYRVLSSSPGPQKTAEGYIMQYLLEEEERGGTAEE